MEFQVFFEAVFSWADASLLANNSMPAVNKSGLQARACFRGADWCNMSQLQTMSCKKTCGRESWMSRVVNTHAALLPVLPQSMLG